MRRETAQAALRRARRPSLVATIAIVLLFSGMALRDLNGLLQGMRVSDGVSYSIGSLAPHTSFPWDSSAKAERVIRSWFTHANQSATGLQQKPVDARRVVHFDVVIDMVFALAYGAAFWFFFQGTGRKFATNKLVRTLVLYGKWGIGATVVADVLENIAEWGLIRQAWPRLRDGAGPGALGIDGWSFLLSTAALVKWLSLLAFVLPVFVGLAAFRFRDWRTHDKGAAWETVRQAAWRLRVQVVVVIALVGLLLGHEQMPDLIRAWSMPRLIWTVLLAVLLTVTVWISGRLVLALPSTPGSTAEPPPANTRSELGFYLSAAVIVVVCLALWAVDIFTTHDVGWGWAVLGVGVFAIAVASWIFRGLAPKAEPALPVEADSPGSRLAEVLAAAVPVGLGLAVFHASFAYAVYLNRWSLRPSWTGEITPGVLVVLGVALGIVGWGAFYLFGYLLGRWSEEVPPLVWGGTLLSSGVVCLVLVWRIVANPWDTAAGLGGVAVYCGFLVTVSLVGSLLMLIIYGLPAPAALRAIGLSRTPVFAFLILWLLIVSPLDKGGYHDVRSLTQPEPVASMTLDEAWSCWLDKNGLQGAAETERCRGDNAGSIASPGAAVPLVLVSTSGGGIRAAYWTALVLDCALEVTADVATPKYPCSQNQRSDNWKRSNAVFAMSGISGGSLGLASYAAFLAEKQGRTEPGWIQARMNADSLSASVAWWLFIEAPRALLQFHNKTDRAEVLERGWEKNWNGTSRPESDGLSTGLLRLQRDHPELPILLLNGTSVADGCRFNTSILDAGISRRTPSSAEAERCRSTRLFDEGFGPAGRSALAATRDFVDFRCEETADIPLSSAALLSARFPFVSPAGRVAQTCDQKKVSYVVDGGYLDTSGASPLIEIAGDLLPHITAHNQVSGARCVVPFLIQIDNGDAGYRNLSARPGELNVPLMTLLASRGGRAANARTDAALLFSNSFGGVTIGTGDPPPKLRDRYTHFNTYAHPGPQPPLGWTLSDRSREDLRAQLGQQQNVAAINEVRSWFTSARAGRLRCPAG